MGQQALPDRTFHCFDFQVNDTLLDRQYSMFPPVHASNLAEKYNIDCCRTEKDDRTDSNHN